MIAAIRIWTISAITSCDRCTGSVRQDVCQCRRLGSSANCREALPWACRRLADYRDCRVWVLEVAFLGLGLRSIRIRGRRDHRCRGRLRDSARTAKRRGGWRDYRRRNLLMRGFWRLRLFLRIDSFRIRNIVFMFIRRWHRCFPC
jgi:hypothetical protein